MTEQRISVAMCTYNGEPYLSGQLESILAQDRLPDEVIVCDDGSSDSTLKILADYGRRFPKLVKIHWNSRNLGPAKNFERAIGLCTGDFIALCDQDDVWHLDKLDRLARRLEREPALGLVFSNAARIDNMDRKLKSDLWKVVGFDNGMKTRFTRGEVLQTFLRRPVATGCTVMFRATLKNECLPIGETLMHDYWISLVAAATSRAGFVDEELLDYRQHTANQIGAPELSLMRRVEDSDRLGVSECVRDAAGLRELISRLGEDSKDEISLIEQKIDFLEFRIRLWSGRGSWLRKSLSLVREVSQGQYGRWGNGPRAVVKDAAILLGIKKASA